MRVGYGCGDAILAQKIFRSSILGINRKQPITSDVEVPTLSLKNNRATRLSYDPTCNHTPTGSKCRRKPHYSFHAPLPISGQASRGLIGAD